MTIKGIPITLNKHYHWRTFFSYIDGVLNERNLSVILKISDILKALYHNIGMIANMVLVKIVINGFRITGKLYSSINYKN